MEFLRFIFSSFWIWLGFVLIIVAGGDVIVKIIAEVKKPTLKDTRYITLDADIADIEELKAGVKANERGTIEQ